MLSQITDVFLTSFYPDHRRGLPGLEHATWFLSEAEQEAMSSFLATERYDGETHDDPERLALVQDEERLLDRVEIAPDCLMDGVDLFPLPGISPGCCGLLLPQSRQTVLFCGDAIPTIEHLEQGMVLPGMLESRAGDELLQGSHRDRRRHRRDETTSSSVESARKRPQPPGGGCGRRVEVVCLP